MQVSIWWFAFGYFACYVPYSAMAKAVSKGAWPVAGEGLSGFSMLPWSVSVSAVGMLLFITAMRWWPYIPKKRVAGLPLPVPGIWQACSGLCTACVIMTTTLAYTFDGVSIVFVMLLMRGGVLIIAPVVDAITGRKTRWYSWVGLSLSMGALVLAFSEQGGAAITLICAIDIAAYLSAYFIRFQFMSRLAKTDDPDVTKSYFVQEQIVASPALVVFLVICGLIGGEGMLGAIREGWTSLPGHPAFMAVLLIGAFSQGTGIFGSLIFLDPRENTYCVPVNRASSILAGVVASFVLTLWLDFSAPSPYKLGGAALIIAAIAFLSVPPMLEKRSA